MSQQSALSSSPFEVFRRPAQRIPPGCCHWRRMAVEASLPCLHCFRWPGSAPPSRVPFRHASAIVLVDPFHSRGLMHKNPLSSSGSAPLETATVAFVCRGGELLLRSHVILRRPWACAVQLQRLL